MIDKESNFDFDDLALKGGFIEEIIYKPNSAAPSLQPTEADLGVWDAGDDTAPIPPRGWLLGNTYCRRFLSSLVGDGGVGKTAVRYAQLLSAAIGRSLTGEARVRPQPRPDYQP
jgi:AAA domain